MAETKEDTPVVEQAPEDDEVELTPGYKPPAQKSLDEIVSADAEDESLANYKKQLLGGAHAGAAVILEPDNPNKVIMKRLSLVVQDRENVSIDLTKTPKEIKAETFVIKEGCEYRIMVEFQVQREIVSGLCYCHAVHKKGIKVDKMKHMMGSYGPKEEVNSFTTPIETAPAGLLMRGDYKIKSKFMDDDKNEYCAWEWSLSVKKDWC